jgi:hypothetical protein
MVPSPNGPERISYDEFLRASHIVDQVILEYLKWFVDSGWENDDGWKYRDEEVVGIKP